MQLRIDQMFRNDRPQDRGPSSGDGDESDGNSSKGLEAAERTQLVCQLEGDTPGRVRADAPTRSSIRVDVGCLRELV